MAGTRVGAVELKRVNAANLPNIKCNVSDRQNRALVELRCKDTIYRLMTKNDDTRELDSYVQQLIECLARDKIFPVEQAVIDTRVYERRDMTQAQEVLTHVKTSHNVILKRAFLWLGLRICPSFINTFCPPPSDRLHRRFLADPAKLSLILKGPNQPVRFYLSLFVNGQSTLHHMVTCCTAEWCSLMPWENHAAWSAVDPNTPSRELLEGRRKRAKQTGAVDAPSYQYLENSNGAQPQSALEWYE